jgi:hypothetical protein
MYYKAICSKGLRFYLQSVFLVVFSGHLRFPATLGSDQACLTWFSKNTGFGGVKPALAVPLQQDF